MLTHAEAVKLCHEELSWAAPWARARKLSDALVYILSERGRFLEIGPGNYFFDSDPEIIVPLVADRFVKYCGRLSGLPSTSNVLQGAVELLRGSVPTWQD